MTQNPDPTLEEVVACIREGNFYTDHDWSTGPAMRVLEQAVVRGKKPSRGITRRHLIVAIFIAGLVSLITCGILFDLGLNHSGNAFLAIAALSFLILTGESEE